MDESGKTNGNKDQIFMSTTYLRAVYKDFNEEKEQLYRSGDEIYTKNQEILHYQFYETELMNQFNDINKSIVEIVKLLKVKLIDLKSISNVIDKTKNEQNIKVNEITPLIINYNDKYDEILKKYNISEKDLIKDDLLYIQNLNTRMQSLYNEDLKYEDKTKVNNKKNKKRKTQSSCEIGDIKKFMIKKDLKKKESEFSIDDILTIVDDKINK